MDSRKFIRAAFSANANFFFFFPRRFADEYIDFHITNPLIYIYTYSNLRWNKQNHIYLFIYLFIYFAA